MEVGLSLGSNISSREGNLKEAKRRILALPGVKLLAQSPIYETEPVGVKPEYQHLDFLNAVLILDGPCPAHECLNHLHRIEDEMGRHRGLDRFAPRAIDIDMIYVDSQEVQSGGLVIPHPHWQERRFVLQPLADVRPDLVLPGCNKTVKEILAALSEAEEVTLFARDW
jgi:2-amino-4-hydroxy-6-hydroxymethyldihydropteridine diphosphokinase